MLEEISVSKNEVSALSTASMLPILNTSAAVEHNECSSAEEIPMLMSRRLPPWLRQNLGEGGGHGETAGLIAELNLETVCSSAKCPNRLECWSSGTATFMILGNVCTRPCGFCSVPKGKNRST